MTECTDGQMAVAACAALHGIVPETVLVILRAAGAATLHALAWLLEPMTLPRATAGRAAAERRREQ